jgi:hypothetical protein
MLSRFLTRFQEQLPAQRGRLEDELAPPATDPSGENELAICHMAEDALEQLEGVGDCVEGGFV